MVLPHKTGRRPYKYFQILLVVITINFNLPVDAQSPSKMRYDSTEIKVRTSDKIKDYKNDKDFIYTEKAKRPTTFWERILRWLSDILKIIFDDKGIAPYVRNILIFLILGFVVIKLLGLKYQTIFFRSRKSKTQIDFETYDEDIYKIDLDKEINDAINLGNYNKAVRYLYLKLLKLLTINEIIEWTKNKTNREYRFEASETKYGKSFTELTYLYEYIWYGDFAIKRNKFDKAHAGFKETFRELGA